MARKGIGVEECQCKLSYRKADLMVSVEFDPEMAVVKHPEASMI